MNLSALNNQQYSLLFDIRRSIRYHDRRRAFFERMHRLTGALTIILAGGVLFELAGTGSPAKWLQWISVLAASLAAVDLIVGYATRANQHAGLRTRFIDLEILILSGDAEPDIWQDYRAKRLVIERDEPPVYRALDLLCHNELCQSEGYTREKHSEQFARVGWFKGFTSHLLHWSNIKPA